MTVIRKYLSIFLISLLSTCILIVINGYSFGLGGQEIHIPLIYKQINADLYAKDILFIAKQDKFSLFYPFYGSLVRITGLGIEQLFIVSYLLVTWLFYVILSLLASKLFKSRIAIFLLFLFFFIPFHIGGTAIQSIETSFVPRWIAFVISLYAIYFLLIRKDLLFYIVLPVIFAIHPISFLYCVFIAGWYIFLSKQFPRLLHIIIFGLLFIFLNQKILGEIYTQLASQEIKNFGYGWLTILRLRNSYAFLDLWSMRAWASLSIISVPLFFYSIYRSFVSKKHDIFSHFIQAILSACILSTIIQYLFSTIYPQPVIISLQASRIWIFGYLGVCLVATKIILLFNQRVVLVCLLGVFALFFYLKSTPIYKVQSSNWIDTQTWIQNHTSKNCIVLTPFDHQGFRIYSKRTIISEYKDGTLSFYSQPFSKEWDNRKREIEHWERLTPLETEQIEDKYTISLLVAENSYHISKPIVYSNNQYSIYTAAILKLNCILH